MLQADGGTRTAAITGGYVALARGLRASGAQGQIPPTRCTARWPRSRSASSRASPVLDLDYAEDSQAETDMNVVMNNGGAFIEIQGTAEGHAFRRHELDAMLNLAAHGIGALFALQTQALQAPLTRIVLASSNAGKLRELRALLAPLQLDARATGRARDRRPSKRPAPPSSRMHCSRRATPRFGGPRRRSPTTPASRWMRSAAARACTRRASPGRARARARTQRCCWRELTGVPESGRGARYQLRHGVRARGG